MEQVKLSEAKDRLEELVDRAASGETIVIERNGAAVELVRRQATSGVPHYDSEKVRRRLEAQKTDTRPQQDIIDEWKRFERY